MKKILLLSSAVAMAASAFAATQVYTTPMLGEVMGISENGKYAAVTDPDNLRSYMWCIDNPTEFVDITVESPAGTAPSKVYSGSEIYAFSNDGVGVGAVHYKQTGKAIPAIYRNGEWEELPILANAKNTNFAFSITGDGQTIGGCQFVSDPTVAIGAKYRPCIWTLSDDGEYDLANSFLELDLLDHMGFYPYCMSPDGKVIAGTIYMGVASQFACYLTTEDGELHYDAELRYNIEPFTHYFNGVLKYFCGNDPETKGQIWTEDPDDPRIIYYEDVYINGLKDDGADEHAFSGMYNFCDWNNNLYGMRSEAYNVNEEGEGEIDRFAAVFNYENKTWLDEENAAIRAYSCGLDQKYIFLQGDNMLVDGVRKKITTEFDFESPMAINSVQRLSQDGKVLGVITEELNEATGEMSYYPMMIVLDEPLVKIENGVSYVADAAVAPVVKVMAGEINVEGAQNVAVYRLDGSLVGNAANISVAPGIYVVKADNVVSKVIVK